MKQGFIRVAAMTPEVVVADTDHNKIEICRLIDEAENKDARIVVFPELCICGYTCGDLFLQDTLLNNCLRSLSDIVSYTKGKKALVFVGLPYQFQGCLYNVAAAIQDGQLLGMIPKRYIPTYSEFYEARYFTKGNSIVRNIVFEGKEIPFGTNILFKSADMESVVVAAEICEDLWVPIPPSSNHALAGATIIVNCSASDETTGKVTYRGQLVASQSARLISGYVYSSAGEGESTQDLVFSGHNLITENGNVLAEAKRFTNQSIYADIDTGRIKSERRRMTTFENVGYQDYCTVYFRTELCELKLNRFYEMTPFVPANQADRDKRCDEILTIQAMGLKKRLKHTNCKCAVVGISGGLDSTLALLVTVRAFDMLGLPRTGIKAVTMPCFGTTDRTYTNAVNLIKTLQAEFIEVDIKEAVTKHFEDIGQDSNVHDVTYENCQARERTQVLMDIANKSGGMVIGTGDMSELALGWATYNGDHMSMYGVNASVPKTLVRHLVKYYADTCDNKDLKKTLLDVLDTPVSPELLPPEDGEISQKTEDLVGPYELHDFFMYYILRFGYSPAKVLRLAEQAFCGSYDRDTIIKWLRTFYRRFFAQQFKRSCLPDGPKVGSVAVSPRGDLRMPSDASGRQWLMELDNL